MNTEQQKQPDTLGTLDATATTTPNNTAFPGNEEKDTLIGYYRQMALIRHFEEKSSEMYNRARIGGYCHLNLGEEATVVGFCNGLAPNDYVYTNYREHGYAIGRGITPPVVMAELFGKEDGCSRGRGGSMHLFDLERHFMGGYGIVGGQVPLAVGAAFALAYRNSNEIVACQMGDGTTNGGPFYEGLNLAKIYHLPVVFFIVNNGYGMGLAVDKGSAIADLHRKAGAFDMRHERVDGNDVLAVRDAVHAAAEYARTQHEPTLIEAVSYRFRGHSVVDPDRYRPEDEVKNGRSQDPIPAFATRLLQAGLIDEHGLHSIDEQVQQEVEDAVAFAEASPFPPISGLFDYIYASDDASQGGK